MLIRKISLFNFLLCLFIIIWGAWVRLSGSGAGCGEHWPLCNGQVVPISSDIKTFIEFTHRFTSGIFGITIFWVTLLASKLKKSNVMLWRFSLLALLFTIIEAGVGALLVKRGLVVDNSSTERAVVIAFHLANTFLLLFSLLGTYLFTYNVTKRKENISKNELVLSMITFFFFIVLGSSGAITALGNTLFPETNLLAGVMKDFSPTAHFLIRLRVLHPVVAIFSCGFFYFLLMKWEKFSMPKLGTSLIYGFIFFSLGFGALNFFLLAPVWSALTHLLIADLLWCALCYRTLTRIYIFSKS